MAAGLLTAAVLVALPFVPAEENTLTGAVLFGFAVGWALLAVLSVRFSDQPQRWAAAPAAFMAVLGVASLSGSAPVHGPTPASRVPATLSEPPGCDATEVDDHEPLLTVVFSGGVACGGRGERLSAWSS